MVPLKIVSYVSRFKSALNLNWVLADLSHGSNSLNSASGSSLKKIIRIQVMNISLGSTDSLNKIKFSNYFSPFFRLSYTNIQRYWNISFFNRLDLGFFDKLFLYNFWLIFCLLNPDPRIYMFLRIPDPGRRNVADETDPNSLHWIQSSNLVWSISTEKGSRLGNHESQLYSLSILVRYNLEIFKRFFQNLFLKFALFTRFLFETKVLIVSTNFKSDSGLLFDFEINYNLIMEQLLV